MLENKLPIAKIILVLIILLSLGTVLGVIAYSLTLKKSSPVVIQPIEEPTATPTIKPTITPVSVSDCPSAVEDIDNNTYNTVQIGIQCWMKENLKVAKNPEGVPITRYCYNNDNKICDTDGGLYDWNTAMNNSIQERAQGICPDGWHMPTDSEWYTLEKGLAINIDTCLSDRGKEYEGSVGGCKPAGEKLVLGGSSGFDAILSGYRYPEGNWNPMFDRREIEAAFWSSAEQGDSAWNRYLNQSDSYRYKNEKGYGFSIRCLKD